MKKLTLTIAFLFSTRMGFGQVNAEAVNTKAMLQYGVSVQGSVSFAQGRPMFRLALNGGIGLEVARCLFPAYNMQLQLYHAGFGTMKKNVNYWPLSGDLTNAFTLTLGVGRPITWMSEADLMQRNSPLYYFGDFCYPALQNPYDFSVSLGTNFIAGFGPGRSGKARNQRVGYFNVHIGPIQLAYTNDGTPFQGIRFGDGEDRYYTGGGFLAAHFRRDRAVNLLRISYEKFTGWSQHSFDVANGLFLNDVTYIDTAQQYFVRSYYSFGAGNISYGLYAALELRNPYKGDVQHVIHRGKYYTLHEMPYRFSKGFVLSYLGGATYYHSHP